MHGQLEEQRQQMPFEQRDWVSTDLTPHVVKVLLLRCLQLHNDVEMES